MALLLCECKSGSYVGQPCPTPDLISSTTTNNYDEHFREIDAHIAVMNSFWNQIYNDIYDNDGKSLNYTHNSTRSSAPSVSMKTTKAYSYDEAKESLKTTSPPLNVTQLINNEATVAKHVNSNSTEFEQGSATFRIQHNGVSILISILSGNHTCGNRDTLLADAPSRN
uniref:Uncharacterized protein n=1 Tax=Heliothis virescens TaxID=7102 RepID=A0A2A4J190_HELVI